MGSAGESRSEILKRQVEGLGYRALATAHSFAAALPLAPSVAAKKVLVGYVGEELKRFEAADLVYKEIDPTADLHDKVQPRLSEMRAPESWLELVVIQLLFGRAGTAQLAETVESSDARIARLAERILDGERVHDLMAAESGNALRNLLHANSENRATAQGYVDRWLPEALRAFGRPGSRLSAVAIELGLKRRDSSEVIREYLRELTRVLDVCGLQLPDESTIGVELPEGVYP